MNGYGPQETAPTEKKIAFWKYLQDEAEKANQQGECLAIQFDSNCPTGSQIITNNPNPQNDNGRLLQSFLEFNPNLILAN